MVGCFLSFLLFPFTYPFYTPLFFLSASFSPVLFTALRQSLTPFLPNSLPLPLSLSHPGSTHQLTPPQYVRPRGSVICIGMPAGAYLKAPVFESVVRMIAIKGSYVGNRKDSAEALDFFRRGLIKVPYKVVGLSELQMVYDKLRAGAVAGRYVLDTSK